MTQVKNTGSQAIPYRGGYILPGRVKDVADEDIDALRNEGDIVVLPSPVKNQRPSAPKESAVAETPLPMPPEEDMEEAQEEPQEEGESEDKPKKRRSRRKSKKPSED